MWKTGKIKATILLLTMVGMLVHNALPHFHHEHDEQGTAYKVANSHEHSHHQHEHGHSHEHEGSQQGDDESPQNSSDDVINLMLAGHSHSSHIHSLDPFTVIGLKSQKSETNIDQDIIRPEAFEPAVFWQKAPPNGDFYKPPLIKPDLFGFRSLRAPPHFG
ncbi:MAG: hypothetical protein HEP71_02585 [Roseivirga sp.]|nr:hypothetical protein [Roseivirga sp.]